MAAKGWKRENGKWVKKRGKYKKSKETDLELDHIQNYKKEKERILSETCNFFWNSLPLQAKCDLVRLALTN